jgi:hypothetical protein
MVVVNAHHPEQVPFTVAKVRALAKYINASEKRWEAFKTVQVEVAEAEGDLIIRPLRCFQDVRTRWDSTNRMLMRARKLRSAITQYCSGQCPHLALSEAEWKQVDYVITILRPFAIFTQLIGTTRDPTIHRVFGVYSLLLNHLDKCERKLKKKRKEWKTLLYDGILAAREKLFDFYSKTTDARHGTLFGIAILLDPISKDTFWKRSHWQEEPIWELDYWVALEELYHRSYEHHPLTKKRLLAPKDIRRRPEPSLDDVMTHIHSSQQSTQSTDAMISDAEAELLDYRQFGRLW